MIAFKPLDGANNQYGQINRKIGDHPYQEAGITGFTPLNPFRVSTNFLRTNDALTFHWPTLSELNDKLLPYLWSLEDIGEYHSNNSPSMFPGFYTKPPPSAPQCIAPTIPPSAILALLIIKSSDKLFFILNPIGSMDIWEWRLICVAFKASMASYPSCLINGQYLIDFYISYPSGYHYNAINK